MAAQKNVYKPRYKIAYQAKSKVWPYKNSRLRGFYSIRGRRLIRRGLYRRYFMVMSSMKWTIARRLIRPYMRRSRAAKRRFRDVFYTKQQLRRFYGKVKENAFRNFFRNHLGSTMVRNRSFFAALERRLDMVVFRMRLLPTIFAAHQLIHHHGVLINGGLVKSPNTNVRIGDIVAIQRPQWQALYWDLYYRAYWRRWGLYIMRRRQYGLLKKKLLWVRRMRQFFRLNLRLKRHLFKTQQLLNTLGILLQSLRNQILYQNNSVSTAIRETTLRSLDNLSYQHRMLLIAERRLMGFSRSELSASAYQNYFSNLLSLFSVNRGLSKSAMLLVLRAKLLELEYHGRQVSSSELYSKDNVTRLWRDRMKELINGHRLWSRQFDHLYRNILRLRLRRLFYSTSELQSENKARPRPLLYFFARRRSKEERRRRLSRLKPVHWYIPSYMLFDFRTLRAVIVEAPRQEQIIYSFRCSLTKIHSFYRSMGL
jgi:ribosomal protein S4